MPYVLIGAVMAGVEVWTQHLAAGQTVVRCDSFASRVAVAGLRRLVLPRQADLAG